MIPAIEPGTLAQAVDRTTAEALDTGALRPIETDEAFVEERGVRFLVRSVSSLARKAEDRRRRQGGPASPKAENPFLHPEPELTVGAISDTHLALLNKFNVLQRHLLIVTREFEHQERLLNRSDFEALWRCMAGYEALGFYNGGAVAGASQPHKHLQTVPLPLVEGFAEVPMTALLESAAPSREVQELPGLPFAHAFAWLGERLHDKPGRAAERTLGLYRRMLEAVGLGAVRHADGVRQSGPYNLLVTRRWMLLVPRSAEHWQGISINSLGYAGSLFVKEASQIDRIRERGPFAALRAVGRGGGA